MGDSLPTRGERPQRCPLVLLLLLRPLHRAGRSRSLRIASAAPTCGSRATVSGREGLAGPPAPPHHRYLPRGRSRGRSSRPSPRNSAGNGEVAARGWAGPGEGRRGEKAATPRSPLAMGTAGPGRGGRQGRVGSMAAPSRPWRSHGHAAAAAQSARAAPPTSGRGADWAAPRTRPQRRAPRRREAREEWAGVGKGAWSVGEWAGLCKIGRGHDGRKGRCDGGVIWDWG